MPIAESLADEPPPWDDGDITIRTARQWQYEEEQDEITLPAIPNEELACTAMENDLLRCRRASSTAALEELGVGSDDSEEAGQPLRGEAAAADDTAEEAESTTGALHTILEAARVADPSILVSTKSKSLARTTDKVK
jgi:hypothetical protein